MQVFLLKVKVWEEPEGSWYIQSDYGLSERVGDSTTKQQFGKGGRKDEFTYWDELKFPLRNQTAFTQRMKLLQFTNKVKAKEYGLWTLCAKLNLASVLEKA